MKTIHAILAVLFASLLVSAFSFAAEPEIEHRMNIKIAADGEMLTVDLEGMEIGETRQSFTESSMEVLVTRTEDGFQLEVDGKEIDVDLPHGDHHTIMRMAGEEGKKVIVRHFHGQGDEHGFHYLHGDRGEGLDVFVERFSVADRLAESGVLDDLDETKRQEILDSLREMTSHEVYRQVRVSVEETREVHDEDP